MHTENVLNSDWYHLIMSHKISSILKKKKNALLRLFYFDMFTCIKAMQFVFMALHPHGKFGYNKALTDANLQEHLHPQFKHRCTMTGTNFIDVITVC